ncbi:MAG: carboxylesterase/lipase family protein [Oscillospiraceae bacterium]|nr:carboxylesterase/lipase family protein [Oscillospiraceae bacterium]
MIDKTKEPVVKTKAGKLRGTYIDGVYRFLGVHYAQDTSGENRFMPPKPVKPWEGEKLAQEYVAKCWQHDHPGVEDAWVKSTDMFRRQQKLMERSSEMGMGKQTEDCLALNIWTKGLGDGKQRPVMVWLHGGGDFAGAAEADWHDGYNLANKQDVVLVTVGHRLAIFGYIDLREYGDKFKDSVNLGHQDMVMALQWIHDNIEAFGGDPGNVTIFGQSGGGGKVCALMGMPGAKGLFHKAIVQSGGFLGATNEKSAAVTKEFLDHLGITKDNIEDLWKYPPEELIRIQREINATRDPSEMSNYLIFPSVLDGKFIKYNPFDGAEGSEYSKEIYMINGGTKDDSRLGTLMNQKVFDYTFDDVADFIARFGYTKEQTGKIIDIYKDMLKDEIKEEIKPVDVYCAFSQDQRGLKGNIERYRARAAVGAAPYYSYVFAFEGPYSDMKAIHGVDVPFFFDNGQYATGIWTADTYVDAMKLSDAAGASWAAFARTGDPSCAQLGVWKPFDEKNRYTMVFDAESKLVSDYRAPGRKIAMGEV